MTGLQHVCDAAVDSGVGSPKRSRFQAVVLAESFGLVHGVREVEPPHGARERHVHEALLLFALLGFDARFHLGVV